MNSLAQYVLPVNKRIFDFYKSHPHISFETMNVILLNFIEQVSTDMSKVMTNTLTSEILSHVKDLRTHITTLEGGIQTWQDSLVTKLQAHNQSFLETTKMVISLATKDNTEKIMHMMERQADTFIQKVSVDLPQVQQQSQHLFLTQFQQQFLSEVRTALTDQPHMHMQQQQQQQHWHTLEARLHQLQQHLTMTTDKWRDEQRASLQMNQEINDFLTKFKGNVQYKGQCSEQLLQTVLTKLFPMAEVINTSGFRASGDLRLKRPEGKPDILFENKLYANNVPPEEVKKFVRDVGEQKCHGILLSQCSGIVGKPNFHLDLHEGKIMVYLHQVDYDAEKIKTAVDIIDHLATKLAIVADEEEANGGVPISMETLKTINAQYQQFLQQKEALQTTAKDIQKKLLLQIDQLGLPEIGELLRTHVSGAQAQATVFPCDVCREQFPTKRGLAAHKKKHTGGSACASGNAPQPPNHGLASGMATPGALHAQAVMPPNPRPQGAMPPNPRPQAELQQAELLHITTS